MLKMESYISKTKNLKLYLNEYIVLVLQKIAPTGMVRNPYTNRLLRKGSRIYQEICNWIGKFKLEKRYHLAYNHSKQKHN